MAEHVHLVAQTEAQTVTVLVAQKLCLVPLMVPQYPSQLLALTQTPVGLAHNFAMAHDNVQPPVTTPWAAAPKTSR